jgi:hypothetical protein
MFDVLDICDVCRVGYLMDSWILYICLMLFVYICFGGFSAGEADITYVHRPQQTYDLIFVWLYSKIVGHKYIFCRFLVDEHFPVFSSIFEGTKEAN